jgi:hypothetical protein
MSLYFVGDERRQVSENLWDGEKCFGKVDIVVYLGLNLIDKLLT